MIPSVLLLVVQTKRTIIRYETATLLEQTQLQEITLKESELIWEEDGRELWVNGKLFDIKSQGQSKDGYICFKGIFDEKETELNEQVDRMLNSKHPTLMLLAKIISLQSPTCIQTQAIYFHYVELTNHSFFNFKQAIYTRSIKKYIPPPKLFV
ncbi:MAG: hypothetical protein EAZ12_02860 [Sphingobacteriia bacterium]|nr:MAG: hypothetical protein EAZ12_02860 [Sphingobacteriia bacterium]